MITDAYAERYGLTRREKEWLRRNIVQVALCQTEDARRVLLGVSGEEAA